MTKLLEEYPAHRDSWSDLLKCCVFAWYRATTNGCWMSPWRVLEVKLPTAPEHMPHSGGIVLVSFIPARLLLLARKVFQPLQSAR